MSSIDKLLYPITESSFFSIDAVFQGLENGNRIVEGIDYMLKKDSIG